MRNARKDAKKGWKLIRNWDKLQQPGAITKWVVLKQIFTWHVNLGREKDGEGNKERKGWISSWRKIISRVRNRVRAPNQSLKIHLLKRHRHGSAQRIPLWYMKHRVFQPASASEDLAVKEMRKRQIASARNRDGIVTCEPFPPTNDCKLFSELKVTQISSYQMPIHFFVSQWQIRCKLPHFIARRRIGSSDSDVFRPSRKHN